MSAELVNWLHERGGKFHPSAEFIELSSGFSIVAKNALPAESTIVSCPFDLAITTRVALKALKKLFPDTVESLTTWSERQCISTYLCFHRIVKNLSEIPELSHAPYVRTLPSREKLRTGLYFSDDELDTFRGTNMYGAVLDRKASWTEEWKICHAVVLSINDDWARKFTWDMYLEAATHLSSRAFPSSLLSDNPTLISSPDIQPVLFPGVDALNHARAHPVSWVVSSPSESRSISLLIHNPTLPGAEIFNNYGPKPNAEFILGYGFSLASNPDDTMLLKLQGKTWELGRDAKGMDKLWNDILALVVSQADGEEEEYNSMLEAADALEGAIEDLFERLPPIRHAQDNKLRPDVSQMRKHYIEGQRDILGHALHHIDNKRHEAILIAREAGVKIVLED